MTRYHFLSFSGVVGLICLLWILPLYLESVKAAPTCGNAPSTPTTTNLGLCKTDASDSVNFFADYGANLDEIDGTAVGVRTPAQGGTGTSTVFTAGSIPFAGASGIYAQDNTGLYYDNPNNRLGLGTASPGAVLHVTGGIAGETALLVNAALSPSAAPLRIQENGTDRIYLTTDFDLGIATTAPAAKLHVAGSSAANDDVAIKAENSFNGVIWEHTNTAYRGALGTMSQSGHPFVCLHCEMATTSDTWRNDESGFGGVLIVNRISQLDVYVNPTVTADDEFTTTVGSTFTIEDNEVGINNVAPAEALDVFGKIQLSDFTAPGADPMCWDGAATSTIGDCSSLQKHKTDIQDMPETLGLPTVLRLRPRVFTWTEEMGGQEDLGFVAEEVEEVAPLIASYTDTGLSGVKFRHYTAALTKAIQQQQMMIDALQARVAQLEKGHKK